MATLNFPDAPDTGDIYTDSNSGFTYEWNGTVWISSDPSTASNIREIDDISSGFNGSTTAFTLNVAANAVEPANVQQLIISVGGVMQNAGDDYTVDGSTITFTTAPSAGLTFFGTLLGTALSLNTVADGSVSPSSLTTTSNYVVGGINVAGIVTGGEFSGDGSGLTGVASTDNIITSYGATFLSNVRVAGIFTAANAYVTGILTAQTLNYNNVTDIYSTGIITATGGIQQTGNEGLHVSSGITTVGIFTATKSTVGLAVTINNTGIDAGIGAGIITAKEFYGDASNMTGAGSTCSVSGFSPPAGSNGLSVFNPCIGINYNQGIKAKSGGGDITFRKDTIGGTIVQTFGVASSVTYTHGQATLNPTNELDSNQKYYVVIPDGAIENLAGSSAAGGVNNYFFTTKNAETTLFGWGYGGRYGGSGNESSPKQVSSINNWTVLSADGRTGLGGAGVTRDGKLYTWGSNGSGILGQNDATTRTAPTQVGTDTTWSDVCFKSQYGAAALKTDGTLWTWGRNTGGDAYGQSGQNNNTNYSSPMQVGTDTTWATIGGMNEGGGMVATKTNGTLWTWGGNDYGQQGQNNVTDGYSSPIQIGTGTDWARAFNGSRAWFAVKTNGTLWACGSNYYGAFGLNNQTNYSSPVQVGTNTNWSSAANALDSARAVIALKTDGTAWSWGVGNNGVLGQDGSSPYSSPKQIGTDTNWSYVCSGMDNQAAIKTDGTGWVWGLGNDGRLGQNNNTSYSSPRQLGSGTSWSLIQYANEATMATNKVKQ